MRFDKLAGVLVLGLFVSRSGAQEDKVYRVLTAEQLESTLQSSGIEFKKTADKKANTYFYDLKVKASTPRLYYLDGKQLMLDTLFAAQSLEKVNEWNLGAKFSRAGVGKDEKGSTYTVLESHLNLKGGVTAGAVKEFLSTFPEELDQFQMFVRDAEPRKDVAMKEPAFKEVSAEKLDKLLDEMKIKYTKVAAGKGTFAYQYESKEVKVVLTNWGKDMMLEAKFPKMPLARVNQYNLERKFIRTVSYKTKSGEYTTLEANLNFLGGVTESILRNFIAIFEEDVSEFARYAQKTKD